MNDRASELYQNKLRRTPTVLKINNKGSTYEVHRKMNDMPSATVASKSTLKRSNLVSNIPNAPPMINRYSNQFPSFSHSRISTMHYQRKIQDLHANNKALSQALETAHNTIYHQDKIISILEKKLISQVPMLVKLKLQAMGKGIQQLTEFLDETMMLVSSDPVNIMNDMSRYANFSPYMNAVPMVESDECTASETLRKRRNLRSDKKKPDPIVDLTDPPLLTMENNIQDCTTKSNSTTRTSTSNRTSRTISSSSSKTGDTPHKKTLEKNTHVPIINNFNNKAPTSKRKLTEVVSKITDASRTNSDLSLSSDLSDNDNLASWRPRIKVKLNLPQQKKLSDKALKNTGAKVPMNKNPKKKSNSASLLKNQFSNSKQNGVICKDLHDDTAFQKSESSKKKSKKISSKNNKKSKSSKKRNPKRKKEQKHVQECEIKQENSFSEPSCSTSYNIGENNFLGTPLKLRRTSRCSNASFGSYKVCKNINEHKLEKEISESPPPHTITIRSRTPSIDMISQPQVILLDIFTTPKDNVNPLVTKSKSEYLSNILKNSAVDDTEDDDESMTVNHLDDFETELPSVFCDDGTLSNVETIVPDILESDVHTKEPGNLDMPNLTLPSDDWEDVYNLVIK